MGKFVGRARRGKAQGQRSASWLHSDLRASVHQLHTIDNIKMNFFLGLTREELCEVYANQQGEKYDFTDKDYEWVSAKEDAMKMSDADLLLWAECNY